VFLDACKIKEFGVSCKCGIVISKRSIFLMILGIVQQKEMLKVEQSVSCHLLAVNTSLGLGVLLLGNLYAILNGQP
jgi:hypothetical protein